jgi:nitroreductase
MDNDLEATLTAIHHRRSVRRYRPEPLDAPTIDRLIDAAIWAPSALNAQPWAFGILQDRAALASYAERAKAVYFVEPAVGELASAPASALRQLREVLSRPGYDVFHGAGTLVVIYATAPEAVPDCFLAGQNLMLGALALGLGTCPIGLARPLLNQADVKDELGVPPEMVAALPIVLGVPDEQPVTHPRRPPRILYRR